MISAEHAKPILDRIDKCRVAARTITRNIFLRDRALAYMDKIEAITLSSGQNASVETGLSMMEFTIQNSLKQEKKIKL